MPKIKESQVKPEDWQQYRADLAGRLTLEKRCKTARDLPVGGWAVEMRPAYEFQQNEKRAYIVLRLECAGRDAWRKAGIPNYVMVWGFEIGDQIYLYPDRVEDFIRRGDGGGFEDWELPEFPPPAPRPGLARRLLAAVRGV